MSTPQPTPFSGEPPANDRDPVLPPSIAQLTLRYLRNAFVVAVLASFILHLSGFALSRIIPVRWGGGGGASGPAQSEPVEMAVMSLAELAQVENAALSLETPAVPDALPQITTELPAVGDSGPGDDSQGFGSDLGEVGPLAGGGDIGEGAGMGLGGSGGGGTSFFGVEAQGNRFAFIIDVSGSMAGPKLDLLKRELIRSIDGLLETSEFIVVQYSDPQNVLVVGEVKGWQTASPSAKRAMRAHVTLLESQGNTCPLPAFELLAATPPRPDVVYFLTDGDFSGDPDQITVDIIKLAKPWRAPVHTLCLDTQASEQRMRRIARETRGTFTFLAGGSP